MGLDETETHCARDLFVSLSLLIFARLIVAVQCKDEKTIDIRNTKARITRVKIVEGYRERAGSEQLRIHGPDNANKSRSSRLGPPGSIRS